MQVSWQEVIERSKGDVPCTQADVQLVIVGQ
jgi:hypothetical protein